MKNIFTVDFTTRTIKGTKASLTRAANDESREHSALMALMEKYPTFSIDYKKRNTEKTKETYKGLTYAKMEGVLLRQPNSEALMIEFNAIKSDRTKNESNYPVVKQWFLERFGTYEDEKGMAAVSKHRTNAILKRAEDAKTISITTAKPTQKAAS